MGVYFTIYQAKHPVPHSGLVLFLIELFLIFREGDFFKSNKNQSMFIRVHNFTQLELVTYFFLLIGNIWNDVFINGNKNILMQRVISAFIPIIAAF